MISRDVMKKSKAVKKSGPKAPWKYTPEVDSKLQSAFANAFTVDEACDYAGISKETYYNWTEQIVGFLDRMDRAKRTPGMKSKKNVVNAINDGDLETSKWWLKNKHSAEFGGNNPNAIVTFNFNQVAKDERHEFNTLDTV